MRLEPIAKVSRPAGVPWSSSVGPVVIKLLLHAQVQEEESEPLKIIGWLWNVIMKVCHLPMVIGKECYNCGFRRTDFMLQNKDLWPS